MSIRENKLTRFESSRESAEICPGLPLELQYITLLMEADGNIAIPAGDFRNTPLAGLQGYPLRSIGNYKVWEKAFLNMVGIQRGPHSYARSFEDETAVAGYLQNRLQHGFCTGVRIHRPHNGQSVDYPFTFIRNPEEYQEKCRVEDGRLTAIYTNEDEWQPVQGSTIWVFPSPPSIKAPMKGFLSQENTAVKTELGGGAKLQWVGVEEDMLLFRFEAIAGDQSPRYLHKREEYPHFSGIFKVRWTDNGLLLAKSPHLTLAEALAEQNLSEVMGHVLTRTFDRDGAALGKVFRYLLTIDPEPDTNSVMMFWGITQRQNELVPVETVIGVEGREQASLWKNSNHHGYEPKIIQHLPCNVPPQIAGWIRRSGIHYEPPSLQSKFLEKSLNRVGIIHTRLPDYVSDLDSIGIDEWLQNISAGQNTVAISSTDTTQVDRARIAQTILPNQVKTSINSHLHPTLFDRVLYGQVAFPADTAPVVLARMYQAMLYEHETVLDTAAANSVGKNGSLIAAVLGGLDLLYMQNSAGVRTFNQTLNYNPFDARYRRGYQQVREIIKHHQTRDELMTEMGLENLIESYVPAILNYLRVGE